VPQKKHLSLSRLSDDVNDDDEEDKEDKEEDVFFVVGLIRKRSATKKKVSLL
tara:strand:- start:1385 stop:1540 length:156 start_codon:yes stop_codon:yes gene_type:complete